MKLWIKKTVATLFGASLLVGGLSGCARHHHDASWSDERVAEVRVKIIEKMSDKLALTDVQKQKLNVLADELQAQRKAFKGDAATDPRTEFKALMAGNTFDRARAQTLLSQKTEAVQSQGPKVITALADFYDSLTPEQQQQVRERLEKRHGWWSRG